MLGQGLFQLQKTLTNRADTIQREFITITERLNKIARLIVEAHEQEDKDALTAEQAQLRERRAAIAEEVNVWRDKAKDLVNQPGDDALRSFLEDLAATTADDEAIQAAIKHVQFLMNATEEELAALLQPKEDEKPLTPAGRLLQRARKEWDLRQDDPAPRQRATVEFANRTGMAQDEAAIAEIEEAVFDPDKFVREIALLTLIQVHRFRALRLADLDAAYNSVISLTKINHPLVVSALVQVVEDARTGFVRKPGSDEALQETNTRLRVAALKRLVEWHTPEARRAVEARQMDRDEQVSYIAHRALETFPGEWTKPIRGTGLLK
jgi:hypothetical protein